MAHVLSSYGFILPMRSEKNIPKTQHTHKKCIHISTTSKSSSWKVWPWNKSLGDNSSFLGTDRIWAMNSVAFGNDDCVGLFAQPGNCWENNCSVLFRNT